APGERPPPGPARARRRRGTARTAGARPHGSRGRSQRSRRLSATETQGETRASPSARSDGSRALRFAAFTAFVDQGSTAWTACDTEAYQVSEDRTYRRDRHG